MNKKCIDCESENLMKYAELKIQYEKTYRYNQLLEQCLDVKEDLCKALREDNEKLRNKLKAYEVEK